MFGRPKHDDKPPGNGDYDPHSFYATSNSRQQSAEPSNIPYAQGPTSYDFYDQAQYRSQNHSSPVPTSHNVHNVENGYMQSHRPAHPQHYSSSFSQYYPPQTSDRYSTHPPGIDYTNQNDSNAHYSPVRTDRPRQNVSSVPYPGIPSPPNVSQPAMPEMREGRPEMESVFYNAQSTGGQNNSQFFYSNPHMPQSTQQHPQQPVRPQFQSFSHHIQQPQVPEPEKVQHPHSHEREQVQQPLSQEGPQVMESAVPYVMAGLQHMTGASAGAGTLNHAAFGAQILQTLAPGAAGYTNQIFGENQERVKSFMRMPKYYFAVNHRYVLRKLSLILVPFVNRTWGRQRGLDGGNFGGAPSDDGTCYLPPRDDVNAPDLYIPVMSFVTYVLVVGFVFGTRNAFTAEVLANYFSRGLGVLSMEVLVIKLLLYLINARPTPWLDVIAYRGYKFVGVVLTIVFGLLVPRLYVPALLYSATAMGIFLMRSHRRIILPRDMELHENHDLARRNAFLLFVCVLQFPIYWILARVLYVKAG